MGPRFLHKAVKDRDSKAEKGFAHGCRPIPIAAGGLAGSRGLGDSQGALIPILG